MIYSSITAAEILNNCFSIRTPNLRVSWDLESNWRRAKLVADWILHKSWVEGNAVSQCCGFDSNCITEGTFACAVDCSYLKFVFS